MRALLAAAALILTLGALPCWAQQGGAGQPATAAPTVEELRRDLIHIRLGDLAFAVPGRWVDEGKVYFNHSPKTGRVPDGATVRMISAGDAWGTNRYAPLFQPRVGYLPLADIGADMGDPVVRPVRRDELVQRFGEPRPDEDGLWRYEKDRFALLDFQHGSAPKQVVVLDC
jgi:hypothetical protein